LPAHKGTIPLIEGNKRAAWAALVMFVDLNKGRWDPDAA
jgi:prophage maintenance system killer protein